MTQTQYAPSVQEPGTTQEPGTLPTGDDAVRDTVRQAYSQAITKVESKNTDPGGCCGDSCCPSPVGSAAQHAGYGGDDLGAVPKEAAESSFGCGNPLAFAGVEPGQTVVDLGSGAGLDLLLAAQKVGPEGRVIGVDMTDAMIDAARRNIERAGAKNVEVRKGVIESLPLEDSSVDWIISNCVINLSPDKVKVFAEIYRVLRPGGRFSVSDIVVEELPEPIRQHAAAYSACIAGAISEADYLKGLDEAGLGELEVSERLVYDSAQLRSIVSSDLDDLGLSDDSLLDATETVAGKVWSAKLTGRKPVLS